MLYQRGDGRGEDRPDFVIRVRQRAFFGWAWF
jgi:hypothetical protein